MLVKVLEGRITWCGFLERLSTACLRHGSAGIATWGSAESCPFISCPPPRTPPPFPNSSAGLSPAPSPCEGLRSPSAMPGLIHAVPVKLVA